uniref:SAP domain-containing protein n=1 Tax=viral metagenome TaxID=1070528 RepID=A0A6C0F6I4_9ZZZZ|tara:strand:- start:11171 stop:12448 length:1278 start_codon:yes stop_codon:yes gene_type:complete
MYITYATFIINNNKIKKKSEQMFSVKDLFDLLSNKETLESSNKRLKIISLQVCSNNKGCTPRSAKGYKDNLVAYIDEKGVTHKLKDANKSEKYVVMFVKATYQLGDVKCSVSIRIPPSGVIKVSIGLSTQTEIKITKNHDKKLDRLNKHLTRDVINVLELVQKIRRTKLVNINAEGYTLLNNDENVKIMNLVELTTAISKRLPLHEFIHVNKDVKMIPKTYLKPIEKGEAPTIGITIRGKVGISGATSIKQIKNNIRDLQFAFDELKNIIRYKNVQPTKSIKKTKEEPVKQCPSRNPPPDENGICPDNMIPKPNNKTKGLCCYKQSLSTSLAKTLIADYANANIPIPKSLQMRLNKYKFASMKLNNHKIPTYNNNKQQFTYDGKKFNCMLLKLNEIRKIAEYLKLNPNGKKADLCKNIMNKLSNK